MWEVGGSVREREVLCTATVVVWMFQRECVHFSGLCGCVRVTVYSWLVVWVCPCYSVQLVGCVGVSMLQCTAGWLCGCVRVTVYS